MGLAGSIYYDLDHIDMETGATNLVFNSNRVCQFEDLKYSL